MDANTDIPQADNAVAQAPAVEDPEFEQLVQAAHALKAKFVDENCDWYRTHKRVPFLAYRLAGILIIILGVTFACDCSCGISVQDSGHFRHECDDRSSDWLEFFFSMGSDLAWSRSLSI